MREKKVLYFRHTPETYGIYLRARELSGGIENPATLFHSGERVCIRNPEKLTPALIQKVIVLPAQVQTTAVRFPIPDEKINEEVSRIIQENWQLQRVMSKHLFKVVMLRYIQFLEEKASETPESTKPVANNAANEDHDADYNLKKAQLEAISLILQEPDSVKINELIDFYKWRIR